MNPSINVDLPFNKPNLNWHKKLKAAACTQNVVHYKQKYLPVILNFGPKILQGSTSSHPLKLKVKALSDMQSKFLVE